jgi:hypothetical protein
LVLAHLRGHVAGDERVHSRAGEAGRNAVERRQVMRDDDVVRFDVDDLLQPVPRQFLQGRNVAPC